MCVCSNFLGVGVSVREGYWRIGVRGLEGVCHQVGGANFSGMTQIKKTEMRNSLKVTSLSLSLHFGGAKLGNWMSRCCVVLFALPI